ncbi:MAG: sigma-70 family RNA polymerase sigma factor [Drouetiella hepatica Uher 2000/2452]|jgi:RNA polymerase sigma-70 factor (ECF subfamily)|uniref:Sigma-70 family RNA polymerase sigma factor n=1 Tax=Drouetiella hepatica Uher 2000/2452 TaxID=904376 RepID=A0A951Q8H6_9CYAN|nr:sigma-70 family RNA polymerase sigma factor [Drouetiella hepatica Uher 2000/2452]
MDSQSSDLPLSVKSLSPDLSDVDLLLVLRNGHTQALGMIYDRYSRLVYSLAFKILANAEEAEDVTQEIFVSLWQRNAYNPARGSLSSFLTTMTRSRSIDRLRSRGSRYRFLQRWEGIVQSETVMATPLEQVSMGERSQIIRAALEELAPNERQVLEIAYYGGLSQSEIAESLNIPLGTVKTRSRQGLLKLRQALQGYV